MFTLFLLSEVPAFLSKSVNWAFLHHQWQLLNNHEEVGQSKCSLGQEELDGRDGETAAALAAASLAFKPYDSSYSNLLLVHAKQLFSFADRFRGLSIDSIPNSKQLYASSGYASNNFLRTINMLVYKFSYPRYYWREMEERTHPHMADHPQR